MDDLKVISLKEYFIWLTSVQPEHNGEYFDGDSDQDEEGAEEPGGS